MRGIGSTLASFLWWSCASVISRHSSFAVVPFVSAHAILDVIVDEKVEFLISQSIMLRQDVIYLIDYRLGQSRIY
jgi:hypothetical protein